MNSTRRSEIVENTLDLPILLAEDNEDDVHIIQRGIEMARLPPPTVVWDGVEAIDYLAGLGVYADRGQYPYPALILLDLTMPRKNGFEVLEWLKDEKRQRFPVVIVLTVSVSRADIDRAYRLGASSYLCKPSGLAGLNELAVKILQFWKLVKRPS